MPHGYLSDLVILKKLQHSDVIGSFHNEIYIAKKNNPSPDNKKEQSRKYDNVWFLKKEDKGADAKCELMAQELCRLLIPGHPKTRLIASGPERYYVISKQVKGYQPLELLRNTWLKEEIKSGHYHGLGAIIVVARFVDEHDLRLPNLCLDDQSNILKLDGDVCLSKFNDTIQNNPLTFRTNDINTLHQFSNYRNRLQNEIDAIWLDDLYDLKFPEIPSKQLNEFQLDSYIALLKISLLPPSVVRKFIDSYFEVSANNRYNFLIEQIKQFRDAAMKHPGFCDFLITNEAKIAVQEFIDYLEHFKTIGKQGIFTEDNRKEIETTFEEMKNKHAPDITMQHRR